MASIAKRSDGKWRARYMAPDGKQRAKHFIRKVDAERWLTEQQSRLNRGEWTAPELSRITVREWARTWLASKAGLKGRSQGSYESLWRTLVEPRWGDYRLDRVTYGEVVTWTAELTGRGLSASRVGQALLCLKQILDLAVLDGRLGRNAARGVKPPRPRRAEPRYLTHRQVAQLAEECGHYGEQYRLFILVAAYCGLRWGEMRALKVRRVDPLRARIDVAESIPDRSADVDTPKNHKHRVVPIPRFICDDLAIFLSTKRPGDLVFTNGSGSLLDNSGFRRNVFDPAVRALGLGPFSPHDLRHTTASLAVSAGANVKAVQRLLGHASAAVTLDIYAALFDDDLDRVAERLDAAARDQRGTRDADVITLDRPVSV
jgi:integrase